ncbi:PAAR domain-containing protein [Silvanigrella paludirubra]|uniref:PAAR domain-containing protein n=1 Tax=Silvanigrella paludirubra TaxID=2499159 RepID=A0A6N6VQM2_9BACT|nr:PAAR domain-containing protein [Silvanigrella paludirubra]KAB8037864.1 PAAR domain-containing protein [Silvanigrella paludirubra]
MKVIIVGDSLNNGGTVITGSQDPEVNLDLFAAVGDKVICHIHGESEIVEGSPEATIDDRAIALEGHKTLCGCSLVASKKRILTFEIHPDQPGNLKIYTK